MRIRSASWLFAFQVSAKVLSFPIGIILAHTLGPAGKGSLSIVQLVATTAVTLFNFGLGSALTYYAARREARGRDAVRLAVTVAALVVLALLGVYLFAGQWFAEVMLHTSNTTLVLLGVITAGPALVGGLIQPYVIGSGSVRNASLVSLASLGFQLLAYVGFAVFHALTLPAAVVIWVTATFTEAAVLCYLAWPVGALHVEFGVSPLVRRAWRYGLLVWVSGTLGFTALRADMYLLDFFKGPAAVGVYSVAVTFAELVWFISNSISGVMMPKVASQREDVLDPMLRLSRVLWPVALFSGIAVSLIAVPVIPFVFGKQFAGAVVPLFLLVPGTVAMAAGSMSSVYLLGTGQPVWATLSTGLNMIVNILCNLVLIPRLGIPGASLSSAISYSVGTLVVILAVRYRAKVSLADLLLPRSEDFSELGHAAWRALRRAG